MTYLGMCDKKYNGVNHRTMITLNNNGLILIIVTYTNQKTKNRFLKCCTKK